MGQTCCVPPFRQRCLLAIMLALGADLSRADELTEKDYLQELPVVLSASRLKQPLSETPNAVTVIDRDMIKASGFRTIADLFNLVPGMYVSYFNGWRPIVSYRGATDEYTRRMQVLVDGRSVYLQPFGVVDWADLPLDINDIERIEVVRGPAATSFGSNSILGVINITTREAAAQHGAALSVTKGNAGNAGISDFSARFGKSGDNWDYRLTLAMNSDNGFNFPKRPSPLYYSFYDGFNNSSANHIANFRGSLHPTATDSFDLQMGYSNGVGATGDPNSTLNQPHNVVKNSSFQQVSWLRTLDRYGDLQLKYYHILRNSLSKGVTLPTGFPVASYTVSDNYHAHRHELELQHTLPTSSRNRLVWGMAMRYESDEDTSMFMAPQSLHQYRLFAHDEWRASQSFVLNGGAMFEDDGMGNRKLSPKLAINYHLTPEQTLRTGISVAYRNPAMVEQSSYSHYPLGAVTLVEFSASGGLRPERALSREIGYVGNFRNGLSIDARVYNDFVSDMIFLDAKLAPGTARGWAYNFRNEISASYTGLEATLKYQWGNSRLTFNYAHQMTSGALSVKPNPLGAATLNAWMRQWNMTVPLNSGSLLYDTRLGDGYSLGAGYYQQGAVQVLVGMNPQPLNRRWDMRMAKQFGQAESRKSGGGEVALVLQNVFQDTNIGYSGYSFDRRAYVTASFGL